MESLLSRKGWYTLAEACLRLSKSFPPSMSEADLLQLAIEQHLTLSVVFSEPALADVFRPVVEADIEYRELPLPRGEGTIKVPANGEVVYALDGQPYQKTDSQVHLAEGSAFDLAMIGGEAADVQDLFWSLHNKHREETCNLDGTFCRVETEDGPRLLRLMEPLNGHPGSYYPIGRLPSTAMLVVSLQSLQEMSTKGREDSSEDGIAEAVDTGAAQWPWGTHNTKLLSHLEAAARRFWTNYDPTDKTTAPTNEQVSGWLQTRGVSRRNAEVIATLLRADGLPTGPRTSY